jgi:hypothetical protein
VTGNVTEAVQVKGTGEEELRRQLDLPGSGGAESGQAPVQEVPKSDDTASEIEKALREGK